MLRVPTLVARPLPILDSEGSSHRGRGEECKMAIEVRSVPDATRGPAAGISAGTAGQARQSRTVSRHYRMAIFRIGLGLLLSRRLHAQVITGAIGLAALAGLVRENEVRTVARLVAWDKQQNLRYQRPA